MLRTTGAPIAMYMFRTMTTTITRSMSIMTMTIARIPRRMTMGITSMHTTTTIMVTTMGLILLAKARSLGSRPTCPLWA